VIAHLVRSEDFERVLRTRSCGSSPHFALHHLPERPSRPPRALKARVSRELSTTAPLVDPLAVDDPLAAAPGALWFGSVVPKRHARRAVTRTLLKRQIRAAIAEHRETLADGLWVVRLRAPFDRGTFVSAASERLKSAARAELGLLMQRGAARPTHAASAGASPAVLP
jgi:ribonuclease P protein component